MTNGIRTTIYPVTDIQAAKALFTTLLGARPAVDEPYYVHFDLGGQEVGLDPKGRAKGMTGPTTYWHVDDIAAVREELLAAGAEPAEDVRDVGNGRLVASVRDGDGNLIGLLQP
ncbi:VOC family protein [Actinophytocola xanthii]|uniref:Glyoxalase n=1 Tax=Actinophytocola xanthii TaxID=1912961 RepID=A0A1Q8CNU7_9PSEU|nr:VOC family protein [Actinophytocola xanthii]OLF15996.1 glyoxalase [Actinophytocola xanthii]